MAGAQDPAPREIEGTLIQSSEALAEAKDLSIPSDVTQAQEAPKVPGYVLTAMIGQGSFARVWKAWQVRTRKVVALKVFTSRAGVNWVFLQREMERLARIDKHPHVVSLLDADLAGQTAWYATELLEGGSLEKFMNPASPVPASRVAAWMEEIAAALSFVHGKGIIHCDLKPGNVLLDESGHVRVADFGQARVMGETSGGLGTLFYMPPEQAVLPKEGEAQVNPDVRWDVYGLGATAYALLTGTAPHAGTMTEALSRTATVADRLEVYRMRVKVSPLTLSPLGRGKGEGREGRVRGVDQDLAAIVMKCLAADAAERYASASEVLADLQARRVNRPVSPLAGRRGYRVRKFLRRNAVATTVGVIAAAALALAGQRLITQQLEVRRQLAYAYMVRAQQHAARGEVAAAASLYAHLNAMEPSLLGGANAAEALAGIAAPRRTLVMEGDILVFAFSPDGRLVAAGCSGRRGAAQVWRIATGDSAGAPFPHDGSVVRLAWSPDGKRLATASERGVLTIWDVMGARALGASSTMQGGILDVAFSRDGSLVATGGADRTARLWDGATCKPVGEHMAHPEQVARVVFSPRGDRLATLAGYPTDVSAKTAFLWSIPVGRLLSGPHGMGGDAYVQFNADGSRMFTGGISMGLLWDTRGGRAIGAMPASFGRAAFSPDGSLLAVANPNGENGLIRRFRAGDGAPMSGPMSHGSGIAVLEFSRDGKHLMSAGSDGTVKLWDPTTGEMERAPLRSGGWITQAGLSADGGIVFAAGLNQSVKMWDGATSEPLGRTIALAAVPLSVILCPDGRTVGALCQGQGMLRLWNAEDLRSPVRTIRNPNWLKDWPVAFALAPDARRVCMGFLDGRVRWWTAATGAMVEGKERCGPGQQVLAFTPDGRTIIATADDRSVRAFDAETGSASPVGMTLEGSAPAWLMPRAEILWVLAGGRIRPWRWRQGRPAGPAIVGAEAAWTAPSPDGEFLAQPDPADRATVKLYDAATGRSFGRDLKHGAPVVAVWHAPSGRILVTLATGQGLATWDVKSRRRLGGPTPVGGELAVLAFDREGTRMITGCTNGVARVWDTRTGAPVSKPLVQEWGVSAVALSPDGRAAATSVYSGGLQIWDAESGEAIGRPLTIANGVYMDQLAFGADGRSLAGLSRVMASGYAWELPWLFGRPDPVELVRTTQAVTMLRVTAAGALAPIPVAEWRALTDKGASSR